MKNINRVFVVVMDSLGVGAMSDSPEYGDTGVNTLGHISEAVENLEIPNLQKLGMANITPLKQVPAVERPLGYRGLLMVALRSQGNCRWEGPLGTPLGLVHWKRASSPVEAGTAGYL